MKQYWIVRKKGQLYMKEFRVSETLLDIIFNAVYKTYGDSFRKDIYIAIFEKTDDNSIFCRCVIVHQ